MGKRRYQYYQPNNKDKDDSFGDCAVRAICKATGKKWLKVFDELIIYARKEQDMPDNSNVYSKYIKNLGFEWVGIKVEKGKKRPTVKVLCKTLPKGTYIVRVNRHLVTIVDGCYYDTWDSGDKCVYGYYARS